MSTVEKSALGPYDAMIATLEDQRTKIDAAIGALKALRDGGIVPSLANGAANTVEAPTTGDAAVQFRAMSIPDAAIKLLRARNRPMKNPEIARELKAGGLIMNSADPVNTVGSVLTRRAADAQDIVKHGRGTWVLREWTRYAPRPKQKPEAQSASDEDLIGEDP